MILDSCPHHDYDHPLHDHQNVHLPLHQFSLFHQVQQRLQMHHLEYGINYHGDGEKCDHDDDRCLVHEDEQCGGYVGF